MGRRCEFRLGVQGRPAEQRAWREPCSGEAEENCDRSLGEKHRVEGMADAKSLSGAFCMLKEGLRNRMPGPREGRERGKT